MNLTQIVLSVCPMDEFNRRREYWTDRPVQAPNRIYTRIETPLVFDSYESAFEILLKNEHLIMISVKDARKGVPGWIKAIPREGIRDDKLGRMADHAKRNHPHNLTYFEAKFGDPEERWNNLAVISFFKTSGQIISRAVEIPRNKINYFTLNDKFEHAINRRIFGLWVPDEYRRQIEQRAEGRNPESAKNYTQSA